MEFSRCGHDFTSFALFIAISSSSRGSYAVKTMMTKTTTGYRITFWRHETVLWTNLGRGFVNLMSGIWAPLSIFPPSPSGIKRYRTTLKLFEIAHCYLNEMILCTDNQAFFAAGIVGCAMVESILMLACVRDRNLVFQTRAWKAFAKKERKGGHSFSELIPWIDFGHLILIGKELGWFSPDMKATEDFFANYSGSTDIDDVPEMMVSPLEAVTRVHQLRNLLHPGNCLRGGLKIGEKMAKLTVGLVYISLIGVLDFYQGGPVDYVDLEVPAAIRNTFGWSQQVEPPTTGLVLEAQPADIG